MPETNYSYGLHLGPHEYFVGDQLRFYLEEMRAMGMTAATTLNKDEYTFQLCREHGIDNVLFRFQMDCTMILWDLAGVQNMKAAGLIARAQPYNEPSDNREWGMEGIVPSNYVETWSNRWIDAARKIVGAGGKPGIQCLGPEDELRPLLRRIKETGNEDLFKDIWLSVHNYADNHDPVFGLKPERDGYDVYDPDGRGLLSFVSPLAFQKVFKEETGLEADVWCTEGGWTIGDSADNRFPKVTPELHAQYTLEVVKAFKAGFLPDWKTPWPRWWKGFTFWLAASTAMQGPMAFEMNAWYWSQIRDPYSTLTLTIDPLKELSGGQPIRPSFDVEPTPIPEPEPAPEGFQLAFKEYAEAHPALALSPASPLTQVTATDVVQRANDGQQRSRVLWWNAGEGVTLYLPSGEVATPVPAPASMSREAVDISNHQGLLSDEFVRCWLANGIDKAVIRVSTEDEEKAIITRQQIEVCRRNRLVIEGYLWLYFIVGWSPESQVASAIDTLKKKSLISRLWLDCEDTVQPGVNAVEYIDKALKACDTLNLKVGIYTSRSWWSRDYTVAGTTRFYRRLLWDARWTSSPDRGGFVRYGGWRAAKMQQYAGNTTLCSIQVDRNVY